MSTTTHSSLESIQFDQSRADNSTYFLRLHHVTLDRFQPSVPEWKLAARVTRLKTFQLESQRLTWWSFATWPLMRKTVRWWPPSTTVAQEAALQSDQKLDNRSPFFDFHRLRWSCVSLFVCFFFFSACVTDRKGWKYGEVDPKGGARGRAHFQLSATGQRFHWWLLVV